MKVPSPACSIDFRAMHVLLIGATGFIGSEIARALRQRGVIVSGLARNIDEAARLISGINWIKGDLRALRAPSSWAPMLHGVDIVINASGALQTGLRDNVAQVQGDAIIALIAATKATAIKRFIQISAANAGLGATTEFMASKARADAVLAASGVDHVILRPGLVIGRNAFGGTELVRTLAGIPLVSFELAGLKPIQCVGLADVVAAVLAALDHELPLSLSVDLVEQENQGLADVVKAHRRWLGFRPATVTLRIPLWCVRPLSLAADALGWLGWRSPLRSTALAALSAGVSGRAEDASALLGRPCTSLSGVLDQLTPAGKADRWHARLGLVYPWALAVLFALWLVSGWIGLAKPHEAAQLLVSGGVSAETARLAVLAGSVADLLIAFGLTFRPTLRPALFSAIGMTLAYLLGSVIVRPDLWGDPLAPMLKAIPALVLALACLAMADER